MHTVLFQNICMSDFGLEWFKAHYTHHDSKDIIRYISAGIADCVSRGVREDDRSERGVKSVSSSLYHHYHYHCHYHYHYHY